MIVVDTSIVVALIYRSDDDHERVLGWMQRVDDDLVISPLVLAECDHVVRRLGGEAAIVGFQEDLARGAYSVRWWQGALARLLAVTADRPDIGLTDASLVALAAHVETTRIATLDERHFRTLKPLTGEPAFTLLPADA